MQYYGIDIHKKYNTYTVVDEQGKIMEQGKIDNSLENFKRIVHVLQKKDSQWTIPNRLIILI